MEPFLATGTLSKPFEVLDIVFALDSDQEGWFKSANPYKAFDRLKTQLRERCTELKGDGVIDCQFEYRVGVGQGVLGGAKTLIQFFAYGTAVKLKE